MVMPKTEAWLSDLKCLHRHAFNSTVAVKYLQNLPWDLEFIWFLTKPMFYFNKITPVVMATRSKVGERHISRRHLKISDILYS